MRFLVNEDSSYMRFSESAFRFKRSREVCVAIGLPVYEVYEAYERYRRFLEGIPAVPYVLLGTPEQYLALARTCAGGVVVYGELMHSARIILPLMCAVRIPIVIDNDPDRCEGVMAASIYRNDLTVEVCAARAEEAYRTYRVLTE